MKLAIDPYLAKLAEKDRQIYLKVLQSMVNYKEIHNALAQDSNTPSEILQKIADQYDSHEIPHLVVANANCPRKILDLALDQIPDSLPSAESDLFLSSTIDDRYSRALATNESLTRKDLEKLIMRSDLAPTLAERTNFPADLFVRLWESLLTDKSDPMAGINRHLLMSLALNPVTPLKILKNIAKYEILNYPSQVESWLISNPGLPTTERANYALLGISPVENRITRDFIWFEPCPSDLVFHVADFPDDLLLELAKIGHPGGLLRTDYIPDKPSDLDWHSIFSTWHNDESIYKTLWPELREMHQSDHPIQFIHATGDYSSDERTYFIHSGLEFEDLGNFHATEGLPDWFISSPNLEDAVDSFSWQELDEVIGMEIEFIQAWSLANVESDYISLTEKANDWIKTQYEISQGDGNERYFPAEIVDSKIRAYSWKKLSKAKKEFLIEFVKRVYLEHADEYFQYAEHYLLCILLNPNTPKDLIEKHLVEIDSELLKQARAIINL